MIGEYYKEFMKTSVPGVKLRAALCCWSEMCTQEPVPAAPAREPVPAASSKDPVARYLRLRVRPAVQALIRIGDIRRIDALASGGFFGEAELDGFIRDALREKQDMAVMYFLHLQDQLRTGKKHVFYIPPENNDLFNAEAVEMLYEKLTEALDLRSVTGTGTASFMGGAADKEACSGSGRSRGAGGRSGRRGDTAGSGQDLVLEEDLQEAVSAAHRFDYRRALARFTEPGEEMELDPDSFDYIPYMMGLQSPERMSLLEPLEYREVNRLQELVIAIDTSASCTLETVRRFLAETWVILTDRENFFSRMTVYLIQCDMAVQRVDVLHSREDWERYTKDIRIEGRSGTSFQPVFRFIEKERKAGRLKRLRALLYFTDGDGVYPDRKPDYETFFVFLQKTKYMDQAPDWIRTLVLDDSCRTAL